jgi:transposase
MLSNAEYLYQSVERISPNHAIDLVYEAGCRMFSTARCFLNLCWHVLVVNLADYEPQERVREVAGINI